MVTVSKEFFEKYLQRMAQFAFFENEAMDPTTMEHISFFLHLTTICDMKIGDTHCLFKEVSIISRQFFSKSIHQLCHFQIVSFRYTVDVDLITEL